MLGMRLISGGVCIAFSALAVCVGGAAAQDKLPVEIAPQIGHTSGVQSVAFSPDGRFARSVSADGTIKLWDAAKGKQLRSFRHADRVTSAAFSPDGGSVLSASALR